MQRDARPVNLNFLTLSFPLTAWVSILHRISGIGIFLGIPFLLWMLQESLISEERFLALKKLLHHPMALFILWGFLAFILYHWVAGMRHLCLDMHLGETKRSGRLSAAVVIGITLFLLCAIGYRLW